MRSERLIRSIMLGLLIIGLSGTVWYTNQTIINFSITEDSIQNTESFGFKVEVLHITAHDGVPLKALFYYDPLKINYSNHSVPLAIFSHGMSSDYLAMSKYHPTFVSYGYAVLIPEHRGHGSNPAPSTLGYEEAKDIIDWLDFIENNFEMINISASAIWGHSMGAQYATLAYIHESLNEHRLKALVEGSGPVNLTREIDFLSNNAEPLGMESSLLDHLYDKNPINFVNSTFPKNVMVLHGTADIIVDYQCAIDFIKQIDPLELTDPQNSREDVVFYSMKGYGHSLDDDFFAKQALRWFNLYIKGVKTNIDQIEIVKNPINQSAAQKGQETLKITFEYMGLLLISIIFSIKPKLLINATKYKDEKNKLLENEKNREINKENGEDNGEDNGKVNGKYIGNNRKKKSDKENRSLSPNRIERLKRPAIGFLILIIAIIIIGGLISLWPIYIATKLVFTLPILLCFWIYFSKEVYEDRMIWKTKIKNEIKQILNPAAIITSGIIILCIELWLTISHSNWLVDKTLESGIRNNWWVTFIWAYLTIQMVLVNRIFEDLFKLKTQGFGKRILHCLAHGLFMGAILGIFLWPYWNATYFIIPAWFSFNIDMVITIIIVFGALFIFFDIALQISKEIFGSELPAAIICGILIPSFAGLGRLILFY